ncbi:MAG: hypothetical protein ABI759_16935 [Candidatus Solibacter sp.]
MHPTCVVAIKFLPLLMLCPLAAVAQSRRADCAALNANDANAAAASPAAANASSGTGSADRQARAGAVATQIQPRRPAPFRPPFSCRCGVVDAGALTAKSEAQEVPIVTGLAGSFRFDHVLLRETARFSDADKGKVSVGLGRANRGADVISPLPLGNATAPHFFWYERPAPPQIAGAYDLVLFFQAAFPLGDGTASNLKAGTVTWEVCGFDGPPGAVQ